VSPAYTHADFVGFALAAFPELREDFEEYRDLLHVQMGAFARVVEHAQQLRIGRHTIARCNSPPRCGSDRIVRSRMRCTFRFWSTCGSMAKKG
jgi:hypothetical protein